MPCGCWFDDERPHSPSQVLITQEGAARSLVTFLGAANNFKHDHALTPEVDALVKAAKVYYTAGFFQTVAAPHLIVVIPIDPAFPGMA